MADLLSKEEQQLYNRQAYAIDWNTQQKYRNSDILIVGLTGLGCEIAKNLCLTGVKSVTLFDTQPVSYVDLSSLFFASEGDVGKQRAAAVVEKMSQLNRFVKVIVAPPEQVISPQYLASFTAVIVVDFPTTTLTEWNNWARENGVKFIAAESRGIAGCVFVDAGERFIVIDKNGEDCVSAIVTGVTGEGVITCHEDKKHECEVGDKVFFTGVVSPTWLNSPSKDDPKLFTVADVSGPFVLKIDAPELAEEKMFLPGGYMHTTKQPFAVSFFSLEKSLENPEITFISDDESKITAGYDLHKIFQCVHSFMQSHGGEPPRSSGEIAQVVEKITAMDVSADVAKMIVLTFSGNLNPMACFIGGIASQEVLKCVSGKYTPTHQWLYYDAREVLSCLTHPLVPQVGSGTRYDGQACVIGYENQTDLQDKTVFVVGAGALGCELVKNLACMGIGTRKGEMRVTDMDTIEMSNLSRQFLFRRHHIGQPKSRVAAQAAKDINPSLNIVAYESKVAPDTEDIFDEHFWETVDVVCNALDNVAARRYVDTRCVYFKKPLFESGTLGPKANSQTVIPYLSESYSSSYDPPEPSIPLCTLKHFPNAIEHTIQWARDKFHEMFWQAPSDTNGYIHDPKFLQSLNNDPGNKSIVLGTILKMLKPLTSIEDCAKWARQRFEDFFCSDIKQLLHNFPVDKVADKGQPFWSGAKKPPTPLVYDPTNEAHIDFVYSAAMLIAQVYGVSLDISSTELAQIAAGVPVRSFVPKSVTYSTSEGDKSDPAAVALADNVNEGDLPAPSSLAHFKLNLLEFEKDDDSNHHIDFITAASNLRAINYIIPPETRDRTKMIAGKIIPAMVTTTALITGLVGFEVLKYLLGCRNLEAYRNSFVNIALPLINFTSPVPAPGLSHKVSSGEMVTWNMWDRLDIKEGRDITLRELVNLLTTRWEIEVSMISLAKSAKLMYSEFGCKPERLAKPVTAVAKELGVDVAGTSDLSLVVTGTICDEDVDIPLLRYCFPPQ